uniref:Histone-lysine N-methyltransferase SETMAR n=1 Tax=Steinernema glaseri TaxID=37863 RepID=A0A1I8AVA2_9BILA
SQSFFDSKPASFYESGIRRLPTKWEQVVLANGIYKES